MSLELIVILIKMNGLIFYFLLGGGEKNVLVNLELLLGLRIRAKFVSQINEIIDISVGIRLKEVI